MEQTPHLQEALKAAHDSAEPYRVYFVDWRGVSREVARISGNNKSDEEIRTEAMRVMQEFCEQRSFKIWYYRSWNCDGITIFDVGSHSEFFHVVPAIKVTESA